MMKRRSLLTVIMALVMLFNVVITPVLATDLGKDAPASSATNVAPEGYTPRNEYLNTGNARSVARESDTPRVLLVEDVLPWDSMANQTVLSQITEFDKVSTAQFLEADLTKYGMIVFANDQPFNSYENYKDFKEHMELFASIGGVIVFGACDAGWSGGDLNELLPGDVSKKTHYVTMNHIADNTHPIVTGSLYDNQVLLDGDLTGSYCSHVSFDEESLPAGSKIILRENDSNRPTLVEYPLGKGRVIASGLTWEFTYERAGNSGSYAPIGYYAQKAMDDMFRYAIRVSSIDVNDLHVLKEFNVEKNSHYIMVSDQDSIAISGATVTIDGTEYVTDATGKVVYNKNYGAKEITVRAAGYKDSTLYYNVQPQQFKLVFLERDNGDGKPYVTMVSEPSTYYDLRNQTKRYELNSDGMLTIKVTGNWGTHRAGQFVIYQDRSTKTVVSSNGSFSFRPGKTFEMDKQIKLKLVAADGTESTPVNLNIRIDAPAKKDNAGVVAGELESLTGLKLVEDKKGKVNNSKVTALFPGDFELKISSLPLEIKKEVKDDGTIVYKGTIGIGKSNYLDDDAKWQSYKKDWENAQKNAHNTKWMKDMMDAYGCKTGSFTVEKKLLNPEIKSVGYIEITQDQNGNVIQSSGGVIISGGNTSTLSKQFLAGPVPIYVDLTGKVNVDIQFGLGYDFVKEGWIYDGALDVGASIALGGGLGVSGLATIGVEGSAGLEINIFPENTGDAVFKADIKAYLIFVFDWRYNIGTVTVPLWGQDAKAARMLALDNSLEESLSFASRDYNTKTSGWNSYPTALRSLQDHPESVHTLQEYIMPNTIPELVEIDGEYVLLFQTDVADRTTGNNVVLMYSVYDNGTDSWSAPLPVCAGASSDLFAETFVIDNELYIVWQKIRKEMTSTDATELLAEMTENIDISFAKWNKSTKTFEQTYINADNQLDMYPYLVADGDNLAVVWVSNSSNDAIGTEGTYSFYVSEYVSGAWSAPRKVYETDTYLSEIAAGYVDGELEILYATDAETANVYRINSDSAEMIPDQTAMGTNLVFSDGQFYWSCAGKVVQYDLSDNAAYDIKSGESETIMPSYRIVRNSTDTAIVWYGNNADGSSVVYASLQTADGWSNPIELINDASLNIQYLDVEFADDGTWHIICTEKNDGEIDNVSLNYIHIDLREDTTLNYVDLDEKERVSGIQPMSFSVTNNGQDTLQNVEILVSDAYGNVYCNKTVPCSIPAGATAIVETDMDLSDLAAYTDLEFCVSAVDEEDTTDNTAIEGVGHVDVSLKLTQYMVDNQLILAAEVSNTSAITANTAISIIEDSMDGIVLDMKNIGTLTTASSYVYLYSIDTTAINFNGADQKYYYIVVNTLEEDLNTHDNTEVIAVYPTRAADDHSHSTANPELHYDDISHWLVCDECGNPYDICDHVFSNPANTHCTVCDYTNGVILQAGDVNSDGEIGLLDLALLQRYVNGWDVAITTTAADVNGDGSVNNMDMALLQRYLNGWDVELVLPE